METRHNVPTQYLLVSDNPTIRKSLSRWLLRRFEIRICIAEVSAAVAQFHECRPDVLLLDVEEYKENEMHLLRELRTLAPTLPVIVVSSSLTRNREHTEPFFVLQKPALLDKLEAVLENPHWENGDIT